MNEQGRLVVPAELRRELRLEPGEDLVAWSESGRLVLATRAELARSVRGILAGRGGSAVDELIAERRVAAQHEQEDLARMVRPTTRSRARTRKLKGRG